VKPALQTHPPIAELDAAELEFTGHEIHVEEVVAPTVGRYVPAEQLKHPIEPLTSLYFPATQAVHVPPFTPVNPALHVQAAITELDASELEFAGQDTHTAEAVAPTATEYKPTAQSVHTTLPLLVLYLPATHAEHTPPSGPVKPALQTHPPMAELDAAELVFTGHEIHVEEVVAPTATEYKPTPQFVHATLPLLVLYFPATHAEHTPPSGPVKPALQTHPPMAELDTAELVFTGHDTHVDEAVAPTVTEYEPTPQSVHATLPLTVLYLPATHAVHTPPSAPVNPALQVQEVISVLETGAFEFRGHVKHVDEALAPTVVE
jgi:ABC-type cobalt transport system substrate-binding protein